MSGVLVVLFGAACTDGFYEPMGGEEGMTGDSGGADLHATVADPFTAAPTCTSGNTFTGGTGPEMRPGEACITCHKIGAGPDFLAAGTVYPTGHEPNDCEGTNGGVVVEITDANGLVTTHVINAVGNFYVDPASGPLTFPIRAKVTAAGRERVMNTPQSIGDCNHCHTETGTQGAPGRIVAP